MLGLERLRGVRSFDPLVWRITVDAGMTTADAAPPRPRERAALPARPRRGRGQSQIGGNIATNAGGPHAFKYGVTGAWVTGLEVVLPPGRARHARRDGPQGRGRLRPQATAGRVGGHARRDHGRLAAPDSGAGGRAPRRRRVSRLAVGCAAVADRPRQRPPAGDARVPRPGALAAAAAHRPLGDRRRGRLRGDRRGRRQPDEAAAPARRSWSAS